MPKFLQDLSLDNMLISVMLIKKRVMRLTNNSPSLIKTYTICNKRIEFLHPKFHNMAKYNIQNPGQNGIYFIFTGTFTLHWLAMTHAWCTLVKTETSSSKERVHWNIMILWTTQSRCSFLSMCFLKLTERENQMVWDM